LFSVVSVDVAIIVSGIVLPRTVEGGIVIAVCIELETVVVYVTVTPPKAEAGIALPTPEAVKGVGIGNVEVFGISAGLEE